MCMLLGLSRYLDLIESPLEFCCTATHENIFGLSSSSNSSVSMLLVVGGGNLYALIVLLFYY